MLSRRRRGDDAGLLEGGGRVRRRLRVDAVCRSTGTVVGAILACVPCRSLTSAIAARAPPTGSAGLRARHHPRGAPDRWPLIAPSPGARAWRGDRRERRRRDCGGGNLSRTLARAVFERAAGVARARGAPRGPSRSPARRSARPSTTGPATRRRDARRLRCSSGRARNTRAGLAVELGVQPGRLVLHFDDAIALDEVEPLVRRRSSVMVSSSPSR